MRNSFLDHKTIENDKREMHPTLSSSSKSQGKKGDEVGISEIPPTDDDIPIETQKKDDEDSHSHVPEALPQLEIFTIDRTREISWEETEMFYSAVKMSNLKQLVVKVWVYDSSLLQLTNLIRASPCLQRFVLEASHRNPEFAKRKAKKIIKSYPHLKEVEFVGYRGVTSEVELVMHFLENDVTLEKILIDPREHESPLNYMWYHYYEVFKNGMK